MRPLLVDRGPFRRVALKSYISRMSTANPHVVFDDHVAAILEQQGFEWEDDPRSVYDPQQLYDALRRYATDWRPKWDAHLEYGFKKAYKIFAKPKQVKCLKPLSDTLVISEALKLNKSAGLPLMVKKADALVYGFDRELQIRKGLKAPNPCVAYKRTQKGNKTRLVWGYPLEMTIMEARFARPLINSFKNLSTPMAFGMTKTELGAKIHRNFEDKPGTTVCLDYSKFDTSISSEMIRRSFRVLATWFTREDQDSLGWETLVKYFITTPIVMPDGHLYTGKNHGVPSGSYFTQMIDSIVNVALCYAMASRFGFEFSERQLFVLGDDSIMQIRGRFSLEEMSAYVASLGMSLHNDEKSVVGYSHFLGAIWEKGKPDAPLDELTRKAVFPETFRSYGRNVKRGAEDVVRSYATSYKSAWKLVPEPWNPCNFMNLDKPWPGYEEHPEYWSATDRFFWEEYKQAESVRRSDATLSLRFML